MKKVLLSTIFAFVFALSALNINTITNAATLTVTPTTSDVYINGTITPFEAYNINDNNYFKLRDIAYHLNGTESQFSVEWNDLFNTISIKTGNSYTPVGGEGEVDFENHISVRKTSSMIMIDNSYCDLTAYNINDNNYFKLRDLGNALNFNVEWSEEYQSVFISTNDDFENVTDTQPSNQYNDYINEVVRLVNIEREKVGVSPLTLDSALTDAAMVRANESNEYFSHTRPDGTSCFTILDEMDINYRTCGENIAIGQATPQQVVTGWMNSEGHRKNILNSRFNKIGVGVTRATQSGYSSGYSWVQLFTN